MDGCDDGNDDDKGEVEDDEGVVLLLALTLV